MEELEWINMREMYRRTPVPEAQIDPDASHIVGKPVKVNDPRLMHLCIAWKKRMNFDPNGTQTYNFYKQAGFIEDLKKAFHEEV